MTKLAILHRSPAVLVRWRIAEGWPVEFITDAIEQFGYRAEDLIAGRVSWRGITHPEDIARLEAEVAELLDTGIEEFSQQYRLISRSGETRWIEDHNVVLRDNQGTATHIEGCLLNVTQRREAERALRESEERYRLIAENVTDVVWVAAIEGLEAWFEDARAGRPTPSPGELLPRLRLTFVSPSVEHVLSYSAVEMLGLSLTDLLTAGTYEMVAAAFVEELIRGAADPAVGPGPRILETQIRGKDGVLRWCEHHVRFLRDQRDGIVGLLGVTRDIGERKELEQAVAELADRERREVGQDLHDGVAQELTGLGYYASSLQASLAEHRAPEAKTAEEVARGIQETIDHLRDIARGLIPVEIDPRGLMDALENMAAGVGRRFRVPCRFICKGPVEVENSIQATELFRIGQEAVTNAAKHSRAGEIVLSLDADPQGVYLEIRDNGRGMAAPESVTAGLGMRIMRHRAGLIGALLDVRQAEGGGTLVRCTLPR